MPTKARLCAVKLWLHHLKQILNQDDVVTLLSPHVNEFHVFLGKKAQENRWDLKQGDGQVALLSWKLLTEKAICFPKDGLILSFNCHSSTSITDPVYSHSPQVHPEALMEPSCTMVSSEHAVKSPLHNRYPSSDQDQLIKCHLPSQQGTLQPRRMMCTPPAEGCLASPTTPTPSPMAA